MSHLFRPYYTKTDPETGQSVKKRVRKWYGRYRDDRGNWQRVPLCADKTAAQTMLAELVRKIDRVRAGLVDPAEEHLSRTIAEHLVDYRAALEGKVRDEKHVRDTIRTVERIAAGCRIAVLAELQRGDEALERYLAQRLKSGLAHRTVNADLVAVRSFCHWLLKRGRLHVDPTIGLERLRVEEDRRHRRRALSDDESRRVLEHTTGSPRRFRGLDGRDRALLYLVALRTGLRRKELLSLTPKLFELDARPATVTVAAGQSKRRRLDVLPLPDEVVAPLRDWLRDKPVDQRLWPGGWWRRSSDMFQHDLREAGIEPVDADGTVLDFHGQRTTFITSLARAGVSPAVAQRLARHSDVNLTMRAYTRLELDDLSRGVEKLPSLTIPVSADASSHRPSNEEREPKTDDPALDRLLGAWPQLTEDVRNAVLKLVFPDA